MHLEYTMLIESMQLLSYPNLAVDLLGLLITGLFSKYLLIFDSCQVWCWSPYRVGQSRQLDTTASGKSDLNVLNEVEAYNADNARR